MRKIIKIYMKYASIHLKSIMQYKVSFLLTAIGQFLVSFNVFLGVYFMLSRFHQIKGFTYPEILLCFSVSLLEFTLAECVARGFDTFGTIISNGEFDRIMVRPQNEILQVLGSRIELSRIGRVLQALFMLAYGIAKSRVEWDVTRILTLLLMLAGGTVVFSGIFMIYASICFFTIEGLEFMNIITDGAREYGKYPISIYGKKILKVCTYVIPFALVQYYPFLYLVGRRNHPIYMLLPAAACFFIVPCWLFWRFGLAHYKSTGS